MSIEFSTRFHRACDGLIFKNRVAVLVIFSALTAIFAFYAAQLKVDAGFKKQIPLKHEYMQTFLDYEQEFGGANRVLIAVVMRDGKGDMFNQSFMQTMENITSDVKKVDAVDDARLRSIFTPNVRFTEVVEDGFAGGNVIPAEFAPNLEGFVASQSDFDQIRANIVKAGIVGRLVSKDFTGAMVWAELVPESKDNKVDYQAIGKQLEDIRAKYENDVQTVHIIGFAKMVSDIADGARSVASFFLLTIAFTWILLFLYSTSFKLASLTVLAALISVVWMLGCLRLMGFGIDPMNMLTPFLIFAIAVSHGEQMINRFRGEIFFGGYEDGSPEELRSRTGVDSVTAARRACTLLIVPGTVALLSSCLGFATILIIPIDMIFELAITATVGVGLTLFTNLILLPVLLSYTELRNMEKKRDYRLRQLTQFDRLWKLLARLSGRKTAAVVIAIGATIWFFAEQRGDKVMIGDAQKGVAELHADARYNVDAVLISDKFSLGIDSINIIAEARPDACTQSFAVMEKIDRFAWHLSNVEGVQKVITLPMAAKIVNGGWNDGSIFWRNLPRNSDSLRLTTQGFETDSGLLNADCSAIPIMTFLTDHRAETIDRVVAKVKEFREQNDGWHPGVNLRVKLAEEKAAVQEKGETFSSDALNLRLATGNAGVMAAINDEVRDVEHVMLFALYLAVFIMCVLSFGSFLAALAITLPLVLVTELGHSLMVQLEIGMKVNTLTVVALGVGMGVDYAIYIYVRMAEALKQGKTLTESYFISLKTTGIAIFYTALTLAAGVAMWIFSDLKFQADMGIMLTFMFVVNMIAAMVFLPALCRWLLRPREA